MDPVDSSVVSWTLSDCNVAVELTTSIIYANVHDSYVILTDMCFWCVLIGVNFRLFIKHNCLLHPYLTLEID